MPAQSIATPSELLESIANGTLVLHIDVDWAIQAIKSRPIVDRLREAIARDPRLADVRFRRLDLTEQEGSLWEAAKSWFEYQHEGESAIFGGCGAVVWIRDGRVRDFVPYAAAAGYDELLARTLRISASSDDSDS